MNDITLRCTSHRAANKRRIIDRLNCGQVQGPNKKVGVLHNMCNALELRDEDFKEYAM